MTPPLHTDFAPAERADKVLLQCQVDNFYGNPLFDLMDSVPVGLLVTNQFRQIVYCNAQFCAAAKKHTPEENFGLRPGEALGCSHANQTPGGCGTTHFCKHCGAARAIINSLQGKAHTDECRILRRDELGEEALDFQVFASPFETSDGTFSLFTVVDISHEKRRQCLERIFFHDVLNLVTGLKYSTQAMLERPPAPEKLKEILEKHDKALDQAAEEIHMQKNLLHAEQGRLLVLPVETDTHEILSDLLGIYSEHKVAGSKHITIAEGDADLTFISDPVLVRRVLGNMIKNALEASEPEQTVTLSAHDNAGKVEFRVHNPGYMDKPVQRQLFKRSFSTKGDGRGLGTYSIKLLTENHLRGTVDFTTSPDAGTTFMIRLPKKI